MYDALHVNNQSNWYTFQLLAFSPQIQQKTSQNYPFQWNTNRTLAICIDIEWNTYISMYFCSFSITMHNRPVREDMYKFANRSQLRSTTSSLLDAGLSRVVANTQTGVDFAYSSRCIYIAKYSHLIMMQEEAHIDDNNRAHIFRKHLSMCHTNDIHMPIHELLSRLSRSLAINKWCDDGFTRFC